MQHVGVERFTSQMCSPMGHDPKTAEAGHEDALKPRRSRDHGDQISRGFLGSALPALGHALSGQLSGEPCPLLSDVASCVVLVTCWRLVIQVLHRLLFDLYSAKTTSKLLLLARDPRTPSCIPRSTR